MKLLTIGTMLVWSTMTFASSIEYAKSAGLKSIPTDKKALMKLIDNPKNKITEEKVSLGKALFFEPRLSKSNLISCNTCHNLATGGIDGVSSAIGHKWISNPHHLNSPTVYNAVFMESQFWDGRDGDLETQAQGPMQAEPEMAISKEMAVERLSSMPDYKKKFKKVFGTDTIQFENIADAIAVFERTLVTPSRLDKFLDGNLYALTNDEKKGLKLFIDKGCVSCHGGIALGGSMKKFPLVGKYKYAEIGDFTGNKEGEVKVPTLRNILQTAPYYHNGAVWNISEAVELMAENQLGLTLSKDEVDAIVSFFDTLDGEMPTIEYPKLPRVTETTPRPDTN